MAGGLSISLVVGNMKVNGKMVKRMEKGHITILSVIHIRVNGKIIKNMVKELTRLLMEAHMLGHIKMI